VDASEARALSFLIAIKKTVNTSNQGTPTCRADINSDGAVNITDIFDFLNKWFTGCP
jgi:hypothetical protein